MKKLLKLFVLALLFSTAPASAAVNTTGYVLGRETLACGASPCAVTAASVVVLNSNVFRNTCSFQNIGTTPLYGCYNGSTCTSSAYDFVLGIPGGTTGTSAMATSYSIGPQGVIWGGGVTFAGSVGGLLVAVCY